MTTYRYKRIGKIPTVIVSNKSSNTWIPVKDKLHAKKVISLFKRKRYSVKKAHNYHW